MTFEKSPPTPEADPPRPGELLARTIMAVAPASVWAAAEGAPGFGQPSLQGVRLVRRPDRGGGHRRDGPREQLAGARRVSLGRRMGRVDGPRMLLSTSVPMVLRVVRACAALIARMASSGSPASWSSSSVVAGRRHADARASSEFHVVERADRWADSLRRRCPQPRHLTDGGTSLLWTLATGPRRTL